MSKVDTVKSSFNMGVLSPEMASRIDLDQYYMGAKRLDNVVVLPTGGATKRNGFKYLADLIGYIAGQYDYEGMMFRIVPYLYEGDVFILVISQRGTLEVFNSDGNQAQAPLDISSRMFGDAIEEIQYKQMANDLVILHRYFKPFHVQRQPGGAFEIKDIPNLKIPTVRFDDIMTGNLWDKCLVSFDGMKNGDGFTLGYADTKEKSFTYQVDLLPLDGSVTDAGDDVSVMVADMQTKLNEIQSGHTVTAVYDVVKRKVVNAAKTQVEVNLREFKGIEIGKPIASPFFCKSKTTHYGKVKVKATGGSYAVRPDNNNDKEAVWSGNRGWPAVAGEHGGRFILAGSLSFPETVWLSRIYAYYDFEQKDSPTATDAIQITLATERSSNITAIIDGRLLTIFTDENAYTVEGEPVITPDSIRARPIGQKGAKMIRPEMLDNAIFYVQQSGAEMNSTAYDFATDAYLNFQASIYSSHLLREIQQMCKTASGNKFNTEYLTVLNRDGTMANYSVLREQQLQNWTPFYTKGEVVDIVGVKDEIFAVVRRGIAGHVKVTLERMTDDAQWCDRSEYFESSVPFDSLAGFDSFVGETLVAVADGYDIELVVDENGAIKLPFKAESLVIGLPFDWIVEPMDINVNLQSGAILNRRKRIIEAKLDMYESRDIALDYGRNQYVFADRHVGFKLREPPQPYTGVKSKRLVGYIDRGSVVVRSNRPVNATVLGIELKIQVKG